jgi:hypothetical protein
MLKFVNGVTRYPFSMAREAFPTLSSVALAPSCRDDWILWIVSQWLVPRLREALTVDFTSIKQALDSGDECWPLQYVSSHLGDDYPLISSTTLASLTKVQELHDVDLQIIGHCEEVHPGPTPILNPVWLQEWFCTRPWSHHPRVYLLGRASATSTSVRKGRPGL